MTPPGIDITMSTPEHKKLHCPRGGCSFASWNEERFAAHVAKTHKPCAVCGKNFTAETMKMHQGHTGHKGVR